MITLLAHVGLPKTGTTYLREILSATEGVSVSSIKEPQYLSLPPGIAPLERLIASGNSWRGASWYQSLFASKDEIWVDLSTQYWLGYHFQPASNIRIVPFVITRPSADQLQSYVKHILRGYYSSEALNYIIDNHEGARDYFIKMRDFDAGADAYRVDFGELTSEPNEAVRKLLENTQAAYTIPKEMPKNQDSNPAITPVFPVLNRMIFSLRGKALQRYIPEKFYAFLLNLRKKFVKANSRPYKTIDADFEVANLVSKIQSL